MTKSGVLYVHRKSTQKGISWTYDHNRNSYNSQSILRLKKMIEDAGLPWIVRDEYVYESVLTDELESMNVNAINIDGKMGLN